MRNVQGWFLAVLLLVPLEVSAEEGAPAIAGDRIGKLEIGKPIPAALLGKQAERLYTTGFYADAQPLEGFTLTDPPVYAVVTGGPFARWGAKNPGQPAPAKLRKEAARLALAGKLKVSMLVVTSPKLKTASGVAVGSRWAELRKARPKLRPAAMPPLWEEPTCLAQEGTIWYFFTAARCKIVKGKVQLADDAAISRIVVRAPEKP